MDPRPSAYLPPSDTLEFKNGLWQARDVSAVSYPEDGNDLCFQIEDDSYWFAHRNECLLTLMQQFPPAGTIYDIGGGNGFVAAAMQSRGYPTVLVEPGRGAHNAAKRGVNQVVWAALEDCGFRPQSLPSAGAFDVTEHIEDDQAFLAQIHRLLVPGGRFFATVPAFPFLWSDADDYAGHFRRYTPRTWSRVLAESGFSVEYFTCIYAWLSIPLLWCRSLPYRLRGARGSRIETVETARADHLLPGSIARLVKALHRWELSRLSARKTIPLGTSLLSVARKT